MIGEMVNFSDNINLITIKVYSLLHNHIIISLIIWNVTPLSFSVSSTTGKLSA